MKTHAPIEAFMDKFHKIIQKHHDDLAKQVRTLSLELGIGKINDSDIDKFVSEKFTPSQVYSMDPKEITISLFNLIIVMHFIEIESGKILKIDIRSHSLYKFFDQVSKNHELSLGQIFTFEFLMLYIFHGAPPMYLDNGFGNSAGHIHMP